MHADANEPLELVMLHLDYSNATIRVGTRLAPEYWEVLKQLLIEHREVFTWSHKEMLGIDNKIAEHMLCVGLAMNKVRQKRRTFSKREVYNYS